MKEEEFEVSAQKEGALAGSQHKERFLTFVRNDKRCCHFDRSKKGCIPEKRYSPRWWRHPKDENVSLRAKRSNLFDRDCFVACAPRNDIGCDL
ncbi:hypothetical protein AUK22_09040 [bacterium CG2_30_54_10]|nr:MAG: hypothetical protein AUK22_09040 [bacterium CG2_30_54_10]